MIPLLLLLAAAPPEPPLPAPAAQLLRRLSQRAEHPGSPLDWSQLWRRELDLGALNALVLVDQQQLTAPERTRLQVALQDHLEARGRARGAEVLRKLTCSLGEARWIKVDAHLELDCRLGQRPLVLELWVSPRGRVADVAVDQVRLSRNLRAQVNRSLRIRGVEGTAATLSKPYLAASG